MATKINPSVWIAAPWGEPSANLAELSPQIISASWQPLQQAWRAAGAESGFQPGWARISWESHGLWLESIFMGKAPGNRARQLNEYTWELGDICEFFLQIDGGTEYLELHVTPENQRLQLAWPVIGQPLQAVRAGTLPLEKFMIPQGDWVKSAVHIAADFWATRTFMPAARLGLEQLRAGQSLRGAACRYDCTSTQPYVLSSTAYFQVPEYHAREAWHRIVLG